ncbi:fluoride efflux transporter CrcB [Methanocaldococcus indicus]|uniref:fluoride efflux transporter CrcB n=1 Tax=Methanocaldococcus indicus TaxID=213231 RepID=UPI003C6CE9DE
MNKFILIGLGGFFGAILRYIISGIFTKYNFPLGTLAVNLIGSFILGFFMYSSLFLPIPSEYRFFIAVGFCGSLTTFSTFSYETFTLIEENEILLAIINIFINVVGCLFMIFLGRLLALYIVRV